MKKIIFAALIWAISSVATAATVTLSVPTLDIPGTLNSSAPIVSLTDDLVQGSFQFQSATPGTAYSASWTLTVDSPVSYEFDVGSLYGASASIFSEGVALFTAISGGSYIGTLATGIYTIIANGITTARGTGGIQFDLYVSEVPVPAAVWLFGSVIAGAFAMRRRAANKVTAVAA